MTGSVDNPSRVTLIANGSMPAGADIGYQSVNGNNVADSSFGSYFSASQDFHIAIDFSLNTVTSSGITAIGFGIGEDSAGTNSAGVLLAVLDTGLRVFSGARRIDDASLIQFLGPAPTTSGRFFVRYESLSGDIIFGVNTTPGSTTPSNTGTFSDTFSGIQKLWKGDELLASFFLRSGDPGLASSMTSATASAVFSNFEVLEGLPVSLVPLPPAIWLFGFGLSGLFGIARRKARSAS